jgi:ubiquinone/menaquinone biosynthesis C-methylase UbiE
VVGVDVSAAMLAKARAAGPENITYIHADVTRHLAWWDGLPFDGCTCELALMDIDDLAGTLSTVTTVLGPGASGPRRTTVPKVSGSGWARRTASCPPS